MRKLVKAMLALFVAVALGVSGCGGGGGGSNGSGDNGGDGTGSQTTNPHQMSGAIQTPLAFTDSNSVTVTTIAGTADMFGSTDGTGSSARFNKPNGITTDGHNLYVADFWNSTIRKVVIATGVVTTIAGTADRTGSTDGTGSAARFWGPTGITTDGTNLYVSDGGNNTIRKVVIATGVVTTVAGVASSAGSIDGAGNTARFNYPNGITTDGSNLYVTDTSNHTLRKVVIATSVVTTVAGLASTSGSTDGIGANARFFEPFGIATDGANLYVSDKNSIRKVVIATGQVTTFAGAAGVAGGSDGIGANASFVNPMGITCDGDSLYVVDWSYNTVRKVAINTAAVTTIAGIPDANTGSTDGSGNTARFHNPMGITTDGTNLYIADLGSHTIRKLAPPPAPTVNIFTIPATSSSLTVPITQFTASDAVGVTGYIVTESAAAPSATASGWSASAPASYTFASQGSKTLYAWAKNAAGAVSTSKSASVTISGSNQTAPTVTAFAIPATSSSLTVSITQFTASDTVGVTGYLVTESATAPLATTSGWTASAPTSYTFTSQGSKTLYAWAKNAAGLVSSSKSASVAISTSSGINSLADLQGTWKSPSVAAFTIDASGHIASMQLQLDTPGSCPDTYIDATFSSISINASSYSFDSEYHKKRMGWDNNATIQGSFPSPTSLILTYSASLDYSVNDVTCSGSGRGTIIVTKQ